MDFSRYFPIWDKLHSEDQAALSAAAQPVYYAKGTLIHDGSICTGLLLVIHGQLRAYTLSKEGREITMYRLFHRDICLFSASCIMKSIQFDITISAEKDTEAILFPAEVYKKIMEQSAPLANYTSEIMASRFSEVMWLIDQIMWQSFDQRLASFLINEAELEESNTLHITHEAIGNHLGSPREVVTRMLQYFQNEGMVKLSRGTVALTDRKALAELA